MNHLPEDNMYFKMRHTVTDEQLSYINAILAPTEQTQLVICNAKAGTGKTTHAVAAAKLRQKPLYFFFAPVEEGTQGFLPGSLSEKSAPYLQPLKDALTQIGDNPMWHIFNDQNTKSQQAWVLPQPHTFTRGINLKDCTVIIDEAQNWTTPQLRKLLTRCHDTCKIIMIGHDQQCDIPSEQSGFTKYIEHFSDQSYASIHHLTKNFRGRLSQHADLI